MKLKMCKMRHPQSGVGRLYLWKERRRRRRLIRNLSAVQSIDNQY